MYAFVNGVAVFGWNVKLPGKAFLPIVYVSLLPFKVNRVNVVLFCFRVVPNWLLLFHLTPGLWSTPREDP